MVFETNSYTLIGTNVDYEQQQQDMDYIEEQYKARKAKAEWDSIFGETEAERIERELEEGDEDWQKFCEEQRKIKAEAQAKAPKPTEAEMDKALEEFYAGIDAEHKTEEDKEDNLPDILIRVLRDWFNTHPDSKVSGGTFDEQWKQYRIEKEEVRKAAEKQHSKEAKESYRKQVAAAKKRGWKARKKREAAKRGPNFKGRQQGKQQKAILRKEAAKKVAEQKHLKIKGEESTYKGKRAQRRKAQDDTEVVIMPRELVIEQPKFFEDSESEDDIEVTEYVRPLTPMPKKMVKVVEKQVVDLPPPVVEDKVVEENDDDDFMTAMLKVQGRKAPEKVVVPEVKVVAVVTRRKKIKRVPLDIQFGKGIIDTARDRRKETDPKYATRCEAFETLADKKEQEVAFARTRMCNSVDTGKRCRHGKRCRFAHSIEELTVRECKFRDGCRFITPDEVKGCVNSVGKAGKPCGFKHPCESDAQYYARLGLKTKVAVVAEVEPVRLTLNKPVKVYKAPVAPWAKKQVVERKPVESKRRVRKSRWDERPKNTPRKSRWGLAKPAKQTSTKVIRVPRAMAEKAMEMCIKQGLVDFRIEYTD